MILSIIKKISKGNSDLETIKLELCYRNFLFKQWPLLSLTVLVSIVAIIFVVNFFACFIMFPSWITVLSIVGFILCFINLFLSIKKNIYIEKEKIQFIEIYNEECGKESQTIDDFFNDDNFTKKMKIGEDDKDKDYDEF